jgi:hypothetical protein
MQHSRGTWKNQDYVSERVVFDTTEILIKERGCRPPAGKGLRFAPPQVADHRRLTSLSPLLIARATALSSGQRIDLNWGRHALRTGFLKVGPMLQLPHETRGKHPQLLASYG